MKKARNQRIKLLWAVWSCAGILAAAIGLLVFLEMTAAKKPESQEQTTPSGPSAAETVQPEPTEETLPVLDLPENPYGPGDFESQGQYMTCTVGPSLAGVDVSAWQEEIDWPQVKAAGMEFAMIRLAWRGSSEGGIFTDEQAVRNYEGARAAGLQVGGYFFSQAITPEEAVEEAEYLLALIDGWQIDLPIAYDWEFAGGPRTDGMDARAITECAKAFCRTIEAAGYDAMIYYNPHMAYYQIYLEELEEYGFWLAMWQEEMDFPYKVDVWQYTDQGAVPGIEGDVDLDLYFIYDDP